MGFRDSSNATDCAHPVISQRSIAMRARISGRNRTGILGSRCVLRAGRFAFSISLFLLAPLLGGCGDCKFLAQNCPAPVDPLAAAETPSPNAAYLIGCPDVLEISFLDYPEWDVLVCVDLDGRLPLEHPGNPRAEGRSLDDVRAELARMANVACCSHSPASGPSA